MTNTQVLKFQQSPAAGKDAGSVAAGAAITLAPRAAMVLRIAEGQAWVTLNVGPHGEAGGDVFLFPGQTLQVAAGQQAVLEPLGGRSLRYRWTVAQALGASPAPWWRRAAFGSTSAEPRFSAEACWA